MWLLLALLAPALWGVANTIDSELINQRFTGVYPILVFSTLLNLIFLPVIFLFAMPELPTLHLLPYFVIIGALDTVYRYPYYKALKADETSIVTALWSLGRIFVPLLAFLVVGEKLQPLHYVAFFLIVLAGSLLTLKGSFKEMRVNSSLYWMILAAFLTSCETVIWKLLFEQTTWSTGFLWSGLLGSLPIVLATLCVPVLRRQVQSQVGAFHATIIPLAIEEAFTFVAGMIYTLALSLAPATLVNGVGSVQPFIVLFYAFILQKFTKYKPKEEVATCSVIKKVVLFAVMAVGIVLIKEF